MKLNILSFFFTLTSVVVSYTQHQFVDITSQIGISGQNGLGHAVGWGDINNDSYEDLAFSNQEGNGFWLYKNVGGSFTNITTTAGLSGNSGEKILFVDINNDTWTDLVLRPRSGTQKIYINNSDETFSLLSSSGVNEGIRLAADFDNDGYIDLLSTSNSTCTIFYNNAGVNFQAQNIGACSGIFAAVALDYNQDGWQDVYLSTYGDDENYLFKNMGDGTFENKTQESGLSYPYSGHGLAVADFNNDGLIDIYVGSYSSSANCKLFQNNGDATFTNVSPGVGANGHQDTRTSSWVDYNNDGWIDLFSSHHNFYSYSNTLQRNDLGTNFVEVGPAMHISGEWIGDYFGVGWADYNNDGDMDLFAAGHIDKYVLWENQNCPNHFVEIKLEGIESNYNAIGASVTLTKDGQTIKRWVQAGQGRLDAHSQRLHFGLGDSQNVDSVLVEWPSGITQLFVGDQIQTDEVWVISEDMNTGVNEINTYVDYKIAPNPARNYFSISTSIDNFPFQLRMFNTQSQTIFHKDKAYPDQLHKLPANIKSGIYFVMISQKNENNILKLVVK